MVVNGPSLLALAPLNPMLMHKERISGMSYGLSEAGYDIRIKQEIRHYSNEEGAWTHVDGVVFKGRFVLASALEEFSMPKNLVGIVHDKSSWARQGVSVFNTVIEPGFCGGLTLELVFHREEQVVIPAGTGIAQVLFHTIAHEAEYVGKYQHQSNNPEPTRFE